MSRIGKVGSTIVLGTKFYVNGVLSDPYAVNSVQVLTTPISGAVLATLSSSRVSEGTYEASWTIPSGTAQGLLYDAWTWQGAAGMDTNTRIYVFRVSGYAIENTFDYHIKPVRGPLFVGCQEVNFFNSITKELIQKIVAQKIIYYSVSDKHTKSHPIYDEAIKKTVFTPIEVNALILYNEPNQTASKFSIDTIYSIEVYFHIHELQERKIVPREGDFVKFGQILYEIEKLNQPQIVYGQIQNKVMIKATCRVSRKSQFEVLDDIKGYNET